MRNERHLSILAFPPETTYEYNTGVDLHTIKIVIIKRAATRNDYMHEYVLADHTNVYV